MNMKPLYEKIHRLVKNYNCSIEKALTESSTNISVKTMNEFDILTDRIKMIYFVSGVEYSLGCKFKYVFSPEKKVIAVRCIFADGTEENVW